MLCGIFTPWRTIQQHSDTNTAASDTDGAQRRHPQHRQAELRTPHNPKGRKLASRQKQPSVTESPGLTCENGAGEGTKESAALPGMRRCSLS